jgi:microcystin degradation protein MlrC
MGLMKNRLRIAIGGFKHETNTFSPFWTEADDFRFVRGEAVLEGGLAEWGQAEGLDLYPTFGAWAYPGGLVRRETYLRLKEGLLAELRAALPLDGVYLDLHGAMEVEEIGDAEGDLAVAVRALVGPEVLISVSLDLHGNISPALVNSANILTAFRTAPHRDYEETQQRALSLLVKALREKLKPVSILLKPPLLLAGESAMTEVEPAKSLYARLAEIDQVPGLMNASLLIGCAWTDSLFTSTSVIVVAEHDRNLAQQEAARFAREVWARRHDFRFGAETAVVDEAIQRAITATERPVFISDSGDNVTAGAAGDIPLLAERLVALGAQEALVAGLADPEAVQQCAAAGEGAEIALSIGGKTDTVNGKPLVTSVHVERLSRSSEEGSGVPTLALVRLGKVHLLLAVDRRPFVNRASIAVAGVDPMQQKIVVVKQGYLFPDLADHAPRVIMALSPGATDLRLEELPYQRLPRPIYPLDGDFAWEPES